MRAGQRTMVRGIYIWFPAALIAFAFAFAIAFAAGKHGGRTCRIWDRPRVFAWVLWSRRVILKRRVNRWTCHVCLP
jgi:hypothetical protein